MTPVEELFQLLWDTPKDKLTWFTIRKQMIEKEQEIMKKSFSNGFKWCCEREFTDEVFDDYNETFNVSEKMKTPIEMLNAIIQMQEANYGRGSDTHMALNELAKEAKEVVNFYTANEK